MRGWFCNKPGRSTQLEDEASFGRGKILVGQFLHPPVAIIQTFSICWTWSSILKYWRASAHSAGKSSWKTHPYTSICFICKRLEGKDWSTSESTIKNHTLTQYFWIKISLHTFQLFWRHLLTSKKCRWKIRPGLQPPIASRSSTSYTTWKEAWKHLLADVKTS